METFPLRTLRGRKMPGEDDKEQEGSDFRIPGYRRKRVLLAQRGFYLEV